MTAATTKLVLASIAGLLATASIASADRGGRYGRERYDASVRYERGYSRGDSHRGDDRGYDRYRYDRGSDHRGYSRGGVSLSFGYSRSSWGSDRSFFNFGYSSGPRYQTRSYYIAPPVYVAPPPPLYYAPAPVYYAPSYYERDYCPPMYRYDRGGYYCR